jgi:hypothetical protein
MQIRIIEQIPLNATSYRLRYYTYEMYSSSYPTRLAVFAYPIPFQVVTDRATYAVTRAIWSISCTVNCYSLRPSVLTPKLQRVELCCVCEIDAILVLSTALRCLRQSHLYQYHQRTLEISLTHLTHVK